MAIAVWPSAHLNPHVCAVTMRRASINIDDLYGRGSLSECLKGELAQVVGSHGSDNEREWHRADRNDDEPASFVQAQRVDCWVARPIESAPK